MVPIHGGMAMRSPQSIKCKIKPICHSSGGIDLQINGALGIAFNELSDRFLFFIWLEQVVVMIYLFDIRS